MDKLPFPVVLVGAALLALAGLYCLLTCRGRQRRYLAWTAVVFAAALLLLLGGGLLLGQFDLAWRNLPAGVFCAILLLSGTLGVLFTLVCFLCQEMKELAPVLRWAVKGLLVACAGAVLYVAWVYGSILIVLEYSGGERVLEYQGQTLLEVDDGFLDPIYNYYVYHGPLVRGSEAVYERQYTRLDGNG